MFGRKEKFRVFRENALLISETDASLAVQILQLHATDVIARNIGGAGTYTDVAETIAEQEAARIRKAKKGGKRT